MSRQLHQAYRIRERIVEGRAGVSLILDRDLPAEPGQFVMAWLPGIEERPLSLMDDSPASLSVADIGPFTHALCSLGPGERLWLRGPFGHGFPLHGRQHLLVAGGSGAASLTLMAKQLRAQQHDVVAALGARTADLLMLPWRFEELGCRVLVATDDGTEGHRGTVLDAVQEILCRDDLSVYACGPERMLLGLAECTVALELPCWMSLERVMRCGLGICGSCACGDRLVCADGPVFSAAEVLALLR